jgi:hypothetical protein
VLSGLSLFESTKMTIAKAYAEIAYWKGRISRPATVYGAGWKRLDAAARARLAAFDRGGLRQAQADLARLQAAKCAAESRACLLDIFA